VNSNVRGSLSRRILQEHRTLVLSIAVLLVLNVIVFAAFIYPLSRRVSSVTERTQAADRELAAARLAHLRAERALTGKSQASHELDTFYKTVLPSDMPSARRLVYPRLEQMAREADLRATGSNLEYVDEKGHTLRQLKVHMELTGSYQGVRDFIHRLERAPEFLVIERVQLRENKTDDAALTLQLDLSTYFKEPAA
jgi:hypothetical protein